MIYWQRDRYIKTVSQIDRETQIVKKKEKQGDRHKGRDWKRDKDIKAEIQRDRLSDTQRERYRKGHRKTDRPKDLGTERQWYIESRDRYTDRDRQEAREGEKNTKQAGAELGQAQISSASSSICSQLSSCWKKISLEIYISNYIPKFC